MKKKIIMQVLFVGVCFSINIMRSMVSNLLEKSAKKFNIDTTNIKVKAEVGKAKFFKDEKNKDVKNIEINDDSFQNIDNLLSSLQSSATAAVQKNEGLNQKISAENVELQELEQQENQLKGEASKNDSAELKTLEDQNKELEQSAQTFSEQITTQNNELNVEKEKLNKEVLEIKKIVNEKDKQITGALSEMIKALSGGAN